MYKCSVVRIPSAGQVDLICWKQRPLVPIKYSDPIKYSEHMHYSTAFFQKCVCVCVCCVLCVCVCVCTQHTKAQIESWVESSIPVTFMHSTILVYALHTATKTALRISKITYKM